MHLPSFDGPSLDGPSFDRVDAAPPSSPVVISVPHAGRDYPLALKTALRVPLAALLPLEDRLVDAVARAARTDQAMIVQRRARAWIDLNRAEHERDPLLDEGAATIAAAHQSAKLRSGLGLVPRRVSGAGDLWARRFSDAEVTARITNDHRPYHAAVAAALEAAHARFGAAVLLDLHSMPPLGPGGTRIVLGDRFGHAAAPRFVDRADAICATRGFSVARNAPYAGGHILERHARPAIGIHAIQLELDRTLYLDRKLHAPGAGFARVVDLVRAILAALADEALRGDAGSIPLAAAE
ncbi:MULTISPECIES: N-formylglutamate amidohydrolase [unclassified Sphingomonas]|jgi:N-formylglutamate amidohydrolase|uniref:N-formylglutamate amidohydrolase n=1 Tax=unclassified Sphingomonas TaxID=196159 RepID=UPI00070051C0|nr:MULTISPECIES: N-formylglutamate amidohydrolase [unclassified Sphingomonas]KQN24260.1 N-formylglutamate amidohydrolase [Sphingomonas sp. Leaf34]KQN27748.1 N-formylglutamate amidohydrolase [Sphingomonas sp. Leaf38]